MFEYKAVYWLTRVARKGDDRVAFLVEVRVLAPDVENATAMSWAEIQLLCTLGGKGDPLGSAGPMSVEKVPDEWRVHLGQ